jgi:O-succinylbenzoic acid--CoA ligase
MKPYIDLQTSGTTGIPKMIRTNKQMMVNSALATGDFFKLSLEIKLCIVCLLIVYSQNDAGSQFYSWLDVDFVAPSSHPLTKNETKYDFVAMVLCKLKFIGRIERCKKMIVGGAKMSKSLEKRLKGKTV